MKKFLNHIKNLALRSIEYLKIQNLSKSKNSLTLNKKKILIYTIFVPVFFSFLYFYSIGRKRYFVRSDVIVRKATKEGAIGFNLQNIIGAGNQSSIEDALFLQTYLESPQVLETLEKIIKIDKAYAKKGLDRYAGLSKNSSREDKYNFFRKQISVSLNERSGILRIRTIGLDPKTTLFINTFLINQSEDFINKLNQSIYKKQLQFLNNQVNKNLNKLEISNKKLTEFQKSYITLDVKSEAELTSSIISELESQLVKLKVNLASLKRRFVDKNAPEIIIVDDQIRELKNQIQIEKNMLVDPNGKNFSNKILEMEELKNKRDYAYELYITSLKAAEKATVDSIQRQRFLAIISEPRLPEKQWNVWRHRGFITTISSFFIIISLTKFFLGMAESHNN